MGTASERLLAGRLAGVLYVLGGVTAAALPFLPGGTSAHRVLCRTARALESWVREGDMVARLGGDE